MNMVRQDITITAKCFFRCCNSYLFTGIYNTFYNCVYMSNRAGEYELLIKDIYNNKDVGASCL